MLIEDGRNGVRGAEEGKGEDENREDRTAGVEDSSS
jgi:hypothetical protein